MESNLNDRPSTSTTDPLPPMEMLHTPKAPKTPKTLATTKIAKSLSFSVKSPRKLQIVEPPSRKKRKLRIQFRERKKVRLNRKEGEKMKKGEDNDDVSDIDIPDGEDLDKNLDETAAKNNLTTCNVRNIIHHIIADKNIQALLNEKGPDATADLVCEPRLTRAYYKQVEEGKSHFPVSLWPISPKKTVKKAPDFVELPLSENSSDDEDYRPSIEELNMTESDYESIASSRASELGSPCPSTPGVTPMIDTPKGTNRITDMGPPATPTTHQVDEDTESAPPKAPLVKSMPGSSHQSDENMLMVLNEANKTSLYPEEPTIAHRTRSKHIIEKDVEELDAAFSPPDVTPGLYEPNESLDLELLFLSTLGYSIEFPNDYDQNDPEYNFLADKEEQTMDHEDYRNDPGVEVSTKEVEDLVCDLESGGEDENLSDFEGDNTRDESSLGVNISAGFPLKIAEFTDAQMEELKQQLQMHIQLLSQMFFLTRDVPGLEEQSKESKTLLTELKYYADSTEAMLGFEGKKSVGRVSNLEAANDIVNAPHTPSHEPCWKPPVPVPPNVVEVVAQSSVFMYPELWPQVGFAQNQGKKVKFMESEDRLFVLGLHMFKEFSKRYENIRKHMMPCKSVKALRTHLKNARQAQRPNMIRSYQHYGELPELPLPCAFIPNGSECAPVERTNIKKPPWLERFEMKKSTKESMKKAKGVQQIRIAKQPRLYPDAVENTESGSAPIQPTRLLTSSPNFVGLRPMVEGLQVDLQQDDSYYQGKIKVKKLQKQKYVGNEAQRDKAGSKRASVYHKIAPMPAGGIVCGNQNVLQLPVQMGMHGSPSVQLNMGVPCTQGLYTQPSTPGTQSTCTITIGQNGQITINTSPPNDPLDQLTHSKPFVIPVSSPMVTTGESSMTPMVPSGQQLISVPSTGQPSMSIGQNGQIIMNPNSPTDPLNQLTQDKDSKSMVIPVSSSMVPVVQTSMAPVVPSGESSMTLMVPSGGSSMTTMVPGDESSISVPSPGQPSISGLLTGQKRKKSKQMKSKSTQSPITKNRGTPSKKGARVAFMHSSPKGSSSLKQFKLGERIRKSYGWKQSSSAKSPHKETFRKELDFEYMGNISPLKIGSDGAAKNVDGAAKNVDGEENSIDGYSKISVEGSVTARGELCETEEQGLSSVGDCPRTSVKINYSPAEIVTNAGETKSPGEAAPSKRLKEDESQVQASPGESTVANLVGIENQSVETLSPCAESNGNEKFHQIAQSLPNSEEAGDAQRDNKESEQRRKVSNQATKDEGGDDVEDEVHLIVQDILSHIEDPQDAQISANDNVSPETENTGNISIEQISENINGDHVVSSSANVKPLSKSDQPIKRRRVTTKKRKRLVPRKFRDKLKRDSEIRAKLLDPQIIEMDEKKGKREERSVLAFLQNVKEAFKDDEKKYISFLKVFHEYPRDGKGVANLSLEVFNFLAGHPHLILQFTSFLPLGTSKELGVLRENLEFTKVRLLLRQAEVYFGSESNQFRRLIKKLTDTTDTLDDPIKVRQCILPLLKGQPQLINSFLNLFPCEKARESPTSRFEEIVLGDDNEDEKQYDSYEEIILTDSEQELGEIERHEVTHKSRVKVKESIPEDLYAKPRLNLRRKRHISPGIPGSENEGNSEPQSEEEKPLKEEDPRSTEAVTHLSQMCDNLADYLKEAAQNTEDEDVETDNEVFTEAETELEEEEVGDGEMDEAGDGEIDDDIDEAVDVEVDDAGDEDEDVNGEHDGETGGDGESEEADQGTSGNSRDGVSSPLDIQDVEEEEEDSESQGEELSSPKNNEEKKTERKTEETDLDKTLTPGSLEHSTTLNENHIASEQSADDISSIYDSSVVSTESVLPVVDESSSISWNRETDSYLITTIQSKGSTSEVFHGIAEQLGDKTQEQVAARFKYLLSLFQTMNEVSDTEEEDIDAKSIPSTP